MAKAKSAVPSGFHTLTPHLVVKGAAEAIDFYKKAFGAEEVGRMAGPGGKIMHAELRIGDSPVMLAEEFPEWGSSGPGPAGSPVTLHLYVQDVDAFAKRAIEAGATVAMPVADMFWGDRYGKLKDPFGHSWAVATHVEDFTPAEMAERAKSAMS